MAMDLKYPRILLKLSGEGLMGPKESGLDPESVDRICADILDVQSRGAQLALGCKLGLALGKGWHWASGHSQNDLDLAHVVADVSYRVALGLHPLGGCFCRTFWRSRCGLSI